MKIIPLTREQMRLQAGGDFFGLAICNETVLVRADLPARVMRAVEAHELQHLADCGKNFGLWHREARAWWAQLKVEPLGTLQAFAMSLTPARIALYWHRFRQGF